MQRSYALLFALLVTLAVDAAAQTAKPVLAVLNKSDNNLALVDPSTMKVTAKIAVGDSPHEVVFSTDGKLAFVANYGAQTPGSTISVIDVAAAKELRRVDLAPLLRPHGLHFVGGKLYFTAETNRAIARYDPTANKVDWMMGTGQNGSHMVAVSADQKRIVTANIGSDSVTVFDLQNAPPAPSRVTQIAVGKQPEAVDLSPDGKEVWTGLNAEGMVEIVDVAQGKSVAKIDTKGRPYRVRFTPDGKHVICTMIPTKEILVIDTATRKEVKRLKVEGTPLGLAFAADNKTIFVSVVEPHVTLKIDLEKMEISGRVETGTVPDGIAIWGM
ncbi:MAG TPA: cytochrome D1 domain-containing protein [Pyrinomonadaceae bacterium]|nr:cytochrome D1 domain-containing protein [Pyrinomonadaceae bacterium]